MGQDSHVDYLVVANMRGFCNKEPVFCRGDLGILPFTQTHLHIFNDYGFVEFVGALPVTDNWMV